MSFLSPPSLSTASSSFSSSTSGGDDTFRIAVMGAAAVGKSAIIHQFIHNRFLRGYWTTVQERYMTNMDVDGRNVTLDIFDTPGAYCFSYIRNTAITNADAFVLVYSVGDEASFETVAVLREMIFKEKPAGTPVIVVGNKIDVTNCTRFMSKDKAQCMVTAGWQHGYVEASAKCNDSICEIFQEIVNKASSVVTPVYERRRVTTPAVLFQSIRRRFRRSKTIH